MLTIIIQFSQMESCETTFVKNSLCQFNTIITTQRWSIIKPSTSNPIILLFWPLRCTHYFQLTTFYMNMNKFVLFNPPPLESKIHIHIDESPEAFNNTTIQGPVHVKSINPSQGSFAQISESPDNNFVVDIIQYETQKAHLPDCVTSSFTHEHRMEHRENACAIHHFDGKNDHPLCIGETATQQRRQKLDVKYHLLSRKHPKRHGHRDVRTAIPSTRDQGMSFDIQNKN